MSATDGAAKPTRQPSERGGAEGVWKWFIPSAGRRNVAEDADVFVSYD